MNDVLEKYVQCHSAPEGDYLYRLYRATNIHTIHGRMASGHLQGRLLKMMVMMQRPHYILEVGTFSGYSAICMAEGLKELYPTPRGTDTPPTPNGAERVADQHAAPHPLRGEDKGGEAPRLFTFEINDEMEDFTRPWIEESPVAEYIDFRIGDAIVEAPKLGVKFDMAFVDGDKRNYVETYEALLPLMTPGAIILADNTLWDGHVVDAAYDHDRQTQGIRRFNDYIRDDRRVEQVILPMRDGLTIIRKK
ncbi:MAG: class I SAM-dependent methyltransferase [Prevotella sp.]|nr:class I SAM-dependent methyltransferase [Prevotella sp.]